MSTETERKFLVTGTAWRAQETGVLLRQGYLSSAKERVVRVRIAGEQAFLTIKGLTRGVSRLEFEYPIPLTDAGRLLDELCERPLVEKTRYTVQVDGHRWEIDEFHGENAGLVVAEIELADENQAFTRPPWLGAEVSEDPRYFNSNLALHPYSRWGEVDR